MQKYLYWRVSITGESLFKPAGDLAVDLAPLSIQECSSEDLSVCLSYREGYYWREIQLTYILGWFPNADCQGDIYPQLI